MWRDRTTVAERAPRAATWWRRMQIKKKTCPNIKTRANTEKHPQIKKKKSSSVPQHTCAPSTHNTTKYRNALQGSTTEMFPGNQISDGPNWDLSIARELPYALLPSKGRWQSSSLAWAWHLVCHLFSRLELDEGSNNRKRNVIIFTRMFLWQPSTLSI